jgi:hypothetical protein
MKKIQTRLKKVSNVLTTISKQIEQIAKSLDFEKPANKAASRKVKPSVTKAAKTNEASAAKGISPAKPMSVLDSVFDKISRAKNGISIIKIQEKTGLGDRQLSNALYKLSKKGKILSKSRGIYTKNQDYKEK